MTMEMDTGMAVSLMSVVTRKQINTAMCKACQSRCIVSGGTAAASCITNGTDASVQPPVTVRHLF